MFGCLNVDSNGSDRLAKQYKRPACDPNGSFYTVDIMSIALFLFENSFIILFDHKFELFEWLRAICLVWA